MSSVESSQGVAPTLPVPIATWALEQDVSFNLDEVRAAVRDAQRDPRLAEYLAAHPSIACIDQGIHTPRTLAARASFVVRLLPEERAKNIVVIGHRFLPFQRFGDDAGEVILRTADGEESSADATWVAFETALAAGSLLEESVSWKPTPAGRADVNAIDLSGSCLGGCLPAELEVRCIDFDGRIYAIAPHTPATTKQWREARDRFGAELLRVIQTPPPGPVFAARQMLHVVAACLEKGGAQPVGPLGPLLTQVPAVQVGQVDGRPAFYLQGATTAPKEGPAARSDSPIAAQLEKFLHVAAQRIKGGAHATAPLSELSWDSDRLVVSAHTRDTWYWTYETSISLSNLKEGLGFLCQCDQFRAKEVCKHGLVLLRETISLLRQPGDSFAERIRHDLARPDWSRALEKIARLAGPARPRDARTEERVTWRIQARGPSLSVQPYVQKVGANGAWTRGRVADADRIARGQEPSATSQDVETVRAGMWHGSAMRQFRGGDLNTFEVLLRLMGHPLLFWGEEIDRPLRVEQAELRLAFVASETGECVPVASVEGVPLDDPMLWWGVEGGVVVDARDRGRVLLAPASREALALLSVLAERKLSFPEEARAELIERLPAIEAILPVDLPAELAGDEVPCDPTIRLRLAPEAPSGLTATMRVRPLAGGAIVAPGSPPERISDQQAGPASVAGAKRVYVRRNLADEVARARAAAEAIGLPAETEPWTWRFASDDDALDFVARLQEAPPQGVAVEWAEDARKMRVTREATPKDLRVSVQDAQDWFGIEGDLDVDGASVSLAAVIDALRSGRRYVRVTGGMWVRITGVFRERLREMADLLQVDHGKLTVGIATAPLLREAVKETGLLKACASWNAFLKRFDHAMELEPDPPKGFRAELRPYQLEGYRWLARLAAWGVGGVLADDMGLGKTVQGLALLVDRAKEGPALVVAPTSVSSNWVAETRRFAPALNPILYRETDRDEEAASFAKGDLVVVSYAMALRDVERLAKIPWGTLVLDEAQFVKNSQTKTAQAIRRIAAKWRLAMTGTPIENHLGDLWSLFRAVSPGVFGSWERFRERFAAPIERDKDAKRREALARMVRPFVLRRTKDEVLRELPARTEVRLDAELSAGERKLYDQARIAALASLASPTGKASSLEGGEDPRFRVLAALTRLRQLACHPRLAIPDAPADSAKLTLFLETVEELREEGHRALVFSQFTSLLAIVREALDAKGIPYRYLDGSTPAAKRDEEVASFQHGEGDLFLISLKAGGTGLNLTAADYVIHLDPWWNPAVEDQATNRAHRIGQTRPVTVYRLVAQGTIEEKILALHASKRDLVKGVLDGTDRAAKLSTEELIALMREG